MRLLYRYNRLLNLAKGISIESAELPECFQWSDTDYDPEHVKAVDLSAFIW